MDIASTTLSLLYAFELPIVFLCALFLGESVLIPAAFLTGQGIWSFTEVFILAYIGTLLSDAVWFAVGPKIFAYAHEFETIKKRSDVFLPKIEHLGNRPFHLLLVSKFVYGTRILTIIYLSRRVKAATFTLYNMATTFLWLIVIMLIGYLAGKSIVNLMPIFTEVKYLALGIIALIACVHFGNNWIRRRFEQRELP